MNDQLMTMGWNPFFSEHFHPFTAEGFHAARVIVENRDNYLLFTASGEFTAEVTGRLLYNAAGPADLPKVGDWVVVSLFESEKKAIIHHILPRRTRFSRKVAGKKSEEQLLASNLDFLFIVQGLDRDFNIRRLERYLVMIYQGDIQPMVLLNKKDLCHNPEQKIAEVSRFIREVPVLAVSAVTGEGMDDLNALLQPARTYALVGSSGVGKSTLINRLLGAEILKTAEVRVQDGRGHHTTTRRQLLALTNGALLIDNPGMREFQLWQGGEGMEDTFSDIDDLSTSCFFADCTHTAERGCAVLQAVADGQLAEDRYLSYHKLRRELEYLDSRQDMNSQLEKKKYAKQLSRTIKAYYKIRKKK